MSLSLRYRPVRLGFLVRHGNMEDLVKAANLATILWGGMYNPIIPVGGGAPTDDLIRTFNVEAVHAVNQPPDMVELDETGSPTQTPDPLVVEFWEKHPTFRWRPHSATDILTSGYFTEDDYPAYLDVRHAIRYHWERGLQNQPETYSGSSRLFSWESEDTCATLFHLWFGRYPAAFDLTANFTALRPQKVEIMRDAALTKETVSVVIERHAYRTVTPLSLSGTDLHQYGKETGGDGVFVGNAADFDDLVAFWNLRAAGNFLFFLPMEHKARFEESLGEHLFNTHGLPQRYTGIPDHITVYHREGRTTYDEARSVMTAFSVRRDVVTCSYDDELWNGLNVRPADFYFGVNHHSALADIDPAHGRYTISVALPPMDFVSAESKVHMPQHLAVSIHPYGEHAYPEFHPATPLPPRTQRSLFP